MRLRLMADRFSGDVPNGDHAFGCCDMCQLRRSRHDVADSIKARLRGPLVRVHHDETAIYWAAVFSKPTFSVLGLRPTAIRSFSNSISSYCRWKRDGQADAVCVRRMFDAFAPVSVRMPVFLKYRSSSFETSSSSTGTSRGSISRTVTFEPKRLKMEANSTPTAPAPMIPRVFGTVKIQNLDVGEDQIRRRAQGPAACGLPNPWRE